MTQREFLTKVLATANITEEVKTEAEAMIAKLDAKNEKRKTTQTKTQKENEGVMTAIIDLLTANGAMIASEISTAMSISTQKVSGVCKLLVDEGKIAVADIKVKGKGKVKQYSVIVTEVADENEEEVAEDTATETAEE